MKHGICGVTYQQIVDAAVEYGTIPATAKKLGVGETTRMSI